MSDIEQHIASLRESIKQFPPRGRHPRFPPSFRQQVVHLVLQLRERGWSAERVARAIGLGAVTVRAWLYQDPTTDPNDADTPAPTLLPVVVTARATRDTVKAPERTFTLHAHAGWTVEGLTLQDLAKLLRGGQS